ncbi:MAG: thioredoxin [Lewinellaceae bacterium]|nr:thioredoxin [Saprospiraceae bacterium]MCB9339615.1 thioredoxin [Lewinellaceae bacterium]
MLKNLSKSDFESTLHENDVVLVDFYADWCGPCKALHPSLEKLATDFDGKAVISKVNVDHEPELSADYEIRSIPALLYFKNGKLAGKQVGLQSKAAIANSLDELISQN